MATLQDVLTLAVRGVPVFPLRPGTKDGFVNDESDHGATTDTLKIFDWFKRDGPYAGHNYGCLMGGRHLAVDVDSHNDGLAAWQQAMAEMGGLEPTLVVQSANGGLHYYFETGGEVFGQADLIKGKVNIRAAGGYVVGPGSTFNGKPYSVAHDAPIAKLPDSLRQRLRTRSAPTEGPRVASDLDTPDAVQHAKNRLAWALPAIEEQSGNNNTFKLACSLYDFGVSYDTCFSLMWELWNPRCLPPWEAEDLKTICANAWTYKQSPIGRDNPVDGFSGMPTDMIPFLAAPQPENIGGDAAAESEKIEWADELAADPQIDWLVDAAIPRVGFGYLVGDSGVGKTQLVATLSLSAGFRVPFFGREIPTRVGTVIVAAEGAYSIAPRLRATAEHGLSLPDGIKAQRWPIVRETNVPDLLTPTGLKNFIAWLRTVDTAMRQRYDAPLGLVVFDTFSATFNVDEDKASEVSKVTRAMGRIARELQAAVLTTHHFGKDKKRGLRGSTALRANVDFVMTVPQPGALDLSKARDAPTGPLGSFTMRPVTLGTGKNGKPIKSLYAECTPASRLADAGAGFTGVTAPQNEKPRKRNKAAEALVSAFEAVAHGAGEAPCVIVRAEFCRQLPGTAVAKRKAFARAKSATEKIGILEIADRAGQDFFIRGTQH